MARRPRPLSFGFSVAKTKELTGYRPLTAEEKRRLNLPKTVTSYTSQKVGVKKLDKSKLISRRRAEQEALYIEKGVRTTYERIAEKNIIKRGGRKYHERYEHALEAYTKLKYGEVKIHVTKGGRIKKLFPIKKSEISKEAEFLAIYKKSRYRGKNRRKIREKLEALHVLYPENESLAKALDQY